MSWGVLGKSWGILEAFLGVFGRIGDVSRRLGIILCLIFMPKASFFKACHFGNHFSRFFFFQALILFFYIFSVDLMVLRMYLFLRQYLRILDFLGSVMIKFHNNLRIIIF